MTDTIYEIHYDKEADFLEVFFGEPTPCFTEEPEEGVFIRKDENTSEVKSVGIFAFGKRVYLLKRLLQKLDKKLPSEIDFSD
ncbi:DUF2283 domain-containing protein [Candidatus Pacearchaeota archaeon]|nr:DUF2283 domain-containing protein [Candidatus Pacearchaeota archaeon]